MSYFFFNNCVCTQKKNEPWHIHNTVKLRTSSFLKKSIDKQINLPVKEKKKPIRNRKEYGHNKHYSHITSRY